MTLEELEHDYNYGNLDDDEIEDKVQEEVEDLLADTSRREVLEETDGMDEEFQDLVREVVDQEVMQIYHDQFDLDREFQEHFEETLESLQQDYSRDEILEMASEQSEEFEGKVRDELE